MFTIYESRYKANKAKRTNPYYNGTEKVVKVCGGYAVVDAECYRIWKKQK